MIQRITDARNSAVKTVRGSLAGACPWTKRLVVSLCLLFSVGGGSTACAAHLTVSASSAAILDAPAADAQVVGTVPQARVLTTTGRKSGDWIQIEAPTCVSGWVYGELVRDNVIAASSVKVRSGPGIGYAALGVLTKGDNIVPRGRSGDWVEVEGLPSFLVWVDRSMMAEGAAVDMTAVDTPPPKPKLVTVVPPSAPHQETRPVPTSTARQNAVSDPVAHVAKPVDAPVVPTPVNVAPVVPRTVLPDEPSTAMLPPPPRLSVSPPVSTRPPTPRRPLIAPPASPSSSPEGDLFPAGLRLLPSAPQGVAVAVSGVLRPVGISLFSPAGYRLVSGEALGPARTLCYLAGSADGEALRGRVGATVTVKGLKYWVSGSREPVVLIRSIR